MAIDLGTPEHGCLLLADISGYTEYMGSTELMHAQDVVADLLETIVGSIEPTFQLAKLEGDAAFAHASIETVNPSMMLDTVEAAYFAFQQRLRDIVHATTCPCEACIRIPDLDLKFFVHDGEYVVRHIARSEELTGPDVILLHRLSKGTAAERIGKPAYAVYTKATLDAMAMNPAILGFVPHTETFSDVGEVEVFIQDLATRWTFEQERNRDFVTSADAVHEACFTTPAAPAVVWDYLTDPVKRPLWQKLVTEVIAQTEGRRGAGSVNHCMHGPDVIVEHVSDWRPFSYITLRYDVAGLEDWAWTFDLQRTDDGGTTLAIRLSDPGGDAWDTYGPDFIASVTDQTTHLAALLAEVTAGV
jgi:uncharacterized protein YndB with AHSA1/START domain